MEADIRRADRAPERGLRRLFFRSPRLVYKGPIASLLRWRCILLLTTIGRRTGKPRRVTISFLPLEPGKVIVFAGWGSRADWFRNLLANPRVQVRIGNEQFEAIARPVEDRAERASLMRRMAAQSHRCGPPNVIRPLMRLVFDYEADIARAVSLDGNLPVVEIVRAV